MRTSPLPRLTGVLQYTPSHPLSASPDQSHWHRVWRKYLVQIVRDIWWPICEDALNIIWEPALQLHQNQPWPPTPAVFHSNPDCKVSLFHGEKSYTAFYGHLLSAEFPDQERTKWSSFCASCSTLCHFCYRSHNHLQLLYYRNLLMCLYSYTNMSQTRVSVLSVLVYVSISCPGMGLAYCWWSINT